MIYVCRKVSNPRNKPKTINRRQYKNFDINAFRSDLNEIFRTQTSNSYSPNILWEEWKEKFLLVAGLHAPPINRKVKSEYAPWITDIVKKNMLHRDYLKKKAVKTGSKNAHDAYKRARNYVNKLVKNTKINYYLSTLNNNNRNPKDMWNTINTLMNKKSKTTNITEL